jgi:hypothetical protein
MDASAKRHALKAMRFLHSWDLEVNMDELILRIRIMRLSAIQFDMWEEYLKLVEIEKFIKLKKGMAVPYPEIIFQSSSEFGKGLSVDVTQSEKSSPTLLIH